MHENVSHHDMSFINSNGKQCILDVAFFKDGEIDDYYNAKIIKY